MLDSERLYVELLFKASKKYSSWDPEIPVEVGDWGRITQGQRGFLFWRKKGIFVREGNIYQDGTAKKYSIPEPQEYGGEGAKGETWVTSLNAHEVDVSATAGGQMTALAQCNTKAAFKFSSGQGAILVMQDDTITAISPPGSLRRLLQDENMRGQVLVSEVHRCASYARLLTSSGNTSVAIGLMANTPFPGAPSAETEIKWVQTTNSGNFKSRVEHSGKRLYTPLYRLVSLTEKNVHTGLRRQGPPPLPDAVPPWIDKNEDSTTPNKMDLINRSIESLYTSRTYLFVILSVLLSSIVVGWHVTQ